MSEPRARRRTAPTAPAPARAILHGAEEARRPVDILHHLAELVEQLEPSAGGDLRPASERLHRELQAGARGRQGIRQLVRDDARERGDVVQRVRPRGRCGAGRRLAPVEQPEAQPGQLEGEAFAAAALPAVGGGAGGRARTGATTQKPSAALWHPTQRLPCTMAMFHRRSVASTSKLVA